ncbi:hypothetical protein QIU19_09755 [Capnocytophaga canimorsus]|nr:hypothetical protein [Capnocytophaga canimorsus]WGU67750.1 hypothetical protein QIU19_09755 [Capnocytophaga canimorsus]
MGGSWNLYIEDDGKAVIEDNNWVEIKRTETTPFLEIWTSSQGANGKDAEQNAKKSRLSVGNQWKYNHYSRILHLR